MKQALLLSALFLLSPNSTHATAPEFLSCPHSISLQDVELDREITHQKALEDKYEYLCQDSDLIFEVLMAPLFRTEINKFHREVLLPAYRDNISNPNFMADKLILEARKHNLCLEDVCEKIFDQCRNSTGSGQNVRQGHQCFNIADQISDLALFKIKTVAFQNQARKERTFLRQKHEAIFTRFQIFSHSKFIQVTDLMDRFVEKVTYLIPDPEEGHGRP